MNSLSFRHAKEEGRRLSMVTCYDHWTARIIAKSSIDAVLVGDSVAMVVHGYPTTVHATVDMMVTHIAAVARGCSNKFIVGDLPFLSVRRGLEPAMEAVQRLMCAGAHAVKLEGAAGNLELIRHIVESGVPVMGHLGLTPQSCHQLGGFKVQSREPQAASALLEEARLLEQAGCFAMVLECIPKGLAAQVTELVGIPCIGIGAGPYVDGQVLVLQDLLGMNPDFQPKFLRVYANGHQLLYDALEKFNEDVLAERFPNQQESYT